MKKTNLKEKIDFKKVFVYGNFTYAIIFAIILILGIVDQTGVMLPLTSFIGSFSIFTFIAFIMLLVYIIFIFGYFIKKKLGAQDSKEEIDLAKVEEVVVEKVEDQKETKSKSKK